MSSLLKKLKFQREKKNLPIDDQGVLNALKYLLDSITDGWILENFSVTNINSKFNEIVSQIMAKKQEHGNTKHTDGAKAREQQTDREIMEYARKCLQKKTYSVIRRYGDGEALRRHSTRLYRRYVPKT